MVLKKGFLPVADANCEFLILGTIPGEISLEKQEYYADKRNKFWKVLSWIFDDNMRLSYEEKISFLKKNHIGLWDVLSSAKRKGSADINIFSESPNDFKSFLEIHPKIRKIGFNGQEAYLYFNRYVKPYISLADIQLVILPSTSGANGWFKLEPWIEFYKGVNK